MGEADINRVKLEAEFDGSIVENGVLHSSYLPPPGWDVQPRAQDSEDDMILNALSAVRNSTTVLETAQTLEEDTDFSASPICPAPLCRQFWKAGNYEDAPAAISQVQNRKNHLHVHPKFLHSNATSHKWAFGAIAELLDNSIDEIQNGASFVIVDKISNPRDGTPALLTQDDGGGMDPEAIRRCMSFGFSDKKSKSAIGRYGNGFKTSTMRLGADVIVFSRHVNNRTLTQSIGLLSYTYLSRTGQDRIVVPMVDYEYDMSTDTFKPLNRYGEEHFQSNLSIILQWSPYQTEAKLMKQFEDIGNHGTKVIVFNLWFTDDGTLEFDLDSDPEDIRLRNSDDTKKVRSHMLISEQHIGNQYRYSLRVYLSILYLRIPQNFCIILRGKVVEHCSIAHDLKYPEFIIYKPQTGGTKEEILTTIGFLKEAPNVNIHGFNVYHKNRLILPFWQVVSYLDSRGRGVVGVLEANFVEPTHNKQDFERTSLFQKLETRLKEMTWEYWDYHCGLIGYQVKKKTPSSLDSPYIAPNYPKPISVDRSSKVRQSSVGRADPVSTLPAGDLLAARTSIQQQCGIKRTQDDLLSSLGRGRRQSRVEPNTHVAGHSAEIQPITLVATARNQQEAMVLRQEHNKLREKCLEYEKSEEELKYKVSRLVKELGEAREEYKRMLTELQSLEVVKAENNEPL
ncbi:protein MICRORCHIDIA 6 isoform X1 [Beta vulgaris subsp. vulgaris]|uniref:protein MICRORCHIDIA 6 isoform X1 n=1 Tax=Beta vulgaris subsp. vulgaris TaxID=3555 RepID=UPI0020370C31|nr:protein MICRORCHIDIA 6 isoform X1 [Beta vulgaris subsp. vulgaris]